MFFFRDDRDVDRSRDDRDSDRRDDRDPDRKDDRRSADRENGRGSEERDKDSGLVYALSDKSNLSTFKVSLSVANSSDL